MRGGLQGGPQHKPRARLLCVADFIENHSHVTFSLKLASLVYIRNTDGHQDGSPETSCSYFVFSHGCDEDFRNIKLMNPWMFSCVCVCLAAGPCDLLMPLSLCQFGLE